ncbi:MAG: CoA-binding protein, partial [Planctomycetota bacterium]
FHYLMRLAVLLDDKGVRGARPGALSNAGFEVVAMADHLGGFALSEFGPATRKRLGGLLARRRLEGIVGVKNLLDLTPIMDDAAYEEAVRAVMEDDGVDVGVIGCVPLTGALQTVEGGPDHAEDLRHEDSVVRRLVRLHQASPKAWVGVVDAGALYDPMVRLLEAEGIPVFRTADRALRLFGRYVAWRLAHG